MSEKKNKIKILFLCTGNSCRSQMAEGWARYLRGDIIDACSAGLLPVDVNPRAIEVMKEAGVDISKQRSKHIGEFTGVRFDYAVTVCDYARQQCPVFNDKVRIIHRNIEDPSFLTGTEEEIMTAFRKTRDEIKDFIITLADDLQQKRSSNRSGND